MLLNTNSNSVTGPVLNIEVEGIKCRALISAGVGSLHASSSLITSLNNT